VSGSPYVKLRFAEAEQTAVSSVEEDLYATGMVEVANVTYDKQVIVHYQGPAGWVDANATYYGPASDAGNELWAFTAGPYPYLPQYSGEAIYFAVEYSVEGITVWDNNGGDNYVVGIQGGDGVPEVPVALGQDNLKVSSFSLTTGAAGVAFAGQIVLKNLAYDKVVTVVESTDHWATVGNVAATYSGSDAGGLETWAFSENLPAGVTSVEFAVVYEVDGASYWDNSLGANYTAQL
jgi:hypothetical protein